MKKHILIPTDFSDNAWSAAVYALKLYAEVECTFYFLHATKMKVSTMSSMTNKLLQVMTDNALKELAELKHMAQTTDANANHSFETILSPNELQDAIEDAIKTNSIDLLVMGTKGATGAKELFFGSNTVHIIKKMALCPILVVPDEFSFTIPKQIGFPTDFKRFYGNSELRPLKDLVDLFNSKIRVVCILSDDKLSDIQEYNMTKLEGYLKNYDNCFHCMPDYAKKVVEINDFIEELSIDILVMISYKHNFIERLIKEPVIKKIGLHTRIPFMVIPEQ